MQDFRKLRVWQKAHRLTLDVYAILRRTCDTRAWPLRDQMLRAAISVPRISPKVRAAGDREFRRFLRTRLGSASELEYHLLLARDLGFMPEPTHDRLTRAGRTEVKRMLTRPGRHDSATDLSRA